MAFTRVCLLGGGDRRQAQAMRWMVERVGVLPALSGSLPRA
jgi:hypothetical protein